MQADLSKKDEQFREFSLNGPDVAGGIVCGISTGAL